MQGATLLLGSTLLLGLRHGLDFDHLAAISDIVGTTPTRKREAFKLSGCYALGHAASVTLLGAAIIFFGNQLPASIDTWAEKAVGITLVGLGLWLVYSLFRRARNADGPQAGSADGPSAPKGHRHNSPSTVSVATTLGVGAIHGIGAETGTQMLLLATIGGTTSPQFAFCLLLTFVVGLLISNSAIALASVAGFASAFKSRKLALALGCLTASFSVCLGLSMLR